MAESINSTLPLPVASSRDVLTDILRDGAQRLLAQAIEAEVTEWIASHAHLKNSDGHRQVVRNGHLPKRTITTGVGPIQVEQPRVLDRRAVDEAEPFSSKILPPYLRKTKSLEELIPWLYLKGVSTSSFPEALEAILGKDAPGLSPANITRLKHIWHDEYERWKKRDLGDKHYVYIWADGIYFNVRLTDERPCVLVLIGATAEGRKDYVRNGQDSGLFQVVPTGTSEVMTVRRCWRDGALIRSRDNEVRDKMRWAAIRFTSSEKERKEAANAFDIGFDTAFSAPTDTGHTTDE